MAGDQNSGASAHSRSASVLNRTADSHQHRGGWAGAGNVWSPAPALWWPGRVRLWQAQAGPRARETRGHRCG